MFSSGSGLPVKPMTAETLNRVDEKNRKSLEIDNYLSANPDVGVNEAARHLGVNKSSISRRRNAKK